MSVFNNTMDSLSEKEKAFICSWSDCLEGSEPSMKELIENSLSHSVSVLCEVGVPDIVTYISCMSSSSLRPKNIIQSGISLIVGCLYTFRFRKVHEELKKYFSEFGPDKINPIRIIFPNKINSL